MKADYVVIKGRTIEYQDKEYNFQKLLSEEFYVYSNKVAQDYCFRYPTDNVVFYNFIQPMLSFYYFFQVNNIKNIKIEEISKKDYYLVRNAAKLLHISCDRKYRDSFLGVIRDKMQILMSACYLLLIELLVPYKKTRKPYSENICLIRTAVTKGKINVQWDMDVLEETKIGQGSFYCTISYWKRAILIIQSCRKAFSSYKRQSAELKTRGLDVISPDILEFVSRRYVHIYLWGKILDEIVKKNGNIKNIITGAYLDSYSLVEQEVAHNNNRKLLVIPHGIEDTIIYPGGVAGDVFYATSKCAAETMNKIYDTNRFVYDKNMVSSMYKVREVTKSGSRHFIYFTGGEGNDLDVLIIRYLSELLSKYQEALYIKYKPRYDKTPFANIRNTKEISSLNEALVNNICMSRGSAVLVEALYNSSTSIQILLPDDGQMGAHLSPSLDDDSILHLYSLEELGQWVESYMLENQKQE